MEFLLPNAEVSYSHISWRNVASALGCLCVQQRTDAGQVKSSSLYNRYWRSSSDRFLFRLIHSCNPVDFAEEKQRVREKATLDDGTARHVLAVASELGDIMAAFAVVLDAWKQLFIKEVKQNDALDGESRSGAAALVPESLREGARTGLRATHFSPERWSMLLHRVKGTQRQGGRETETREPEELASISSFTTPAPPPQQSWPAAPPSNSTPAASSLDPLGPPKPPKRFPVAALQAIREGHLSSLELPADGVATAGASTFAEPARASPPQHTEQRPRVSPSPPPLAPAGAAAQKPITSSSSGTIPEAAAKGRTVPDDVTALRSWLAALPFAAFHKQHISSALSRGWKKVHPRRVRWREVKEAFDIRTTDPVDRIVVVSAGLLLLLALLFLLLHWTPSHWRLTSLELLVALLVAFLSVLVLLFYLKTHENYHPMDVASLFQYNSGERVLRHRPQLQPLTSGEQHLLTQLQNYGAPYSCVVLRPLRGWNQKDGTAGWCKSWHFRGLHLTERQSPFNTSAVEVRAAINISNASIGSLQSVLLDPFFLEARHGKNIPPQHCPSFMYPLCTEMEVVKQLEYNLFIVRYVFHSRVLGVTPFEYYAYVSPAVLLDKDQQAELNIRHPFKGQHDTPNTMSSTNASAGYAYLSCSVHCPREALGGVAVSPGSPTTSAQHATLHHLMWLGFDEPDGSLTLCVYRSMSIPSLETHQVVYRHTVYRSVIHALFRVVKVLQHRGRLPNELIAYRNNSRYYPFLDEGNTAPQGSRSPQPPPGIHWSSDRTIEAGGAPALEPLVALAGPVELYSARFPSPTTPFPGVYQSRKVLPSPLVRFLEHMAAAEKGSVWECLQDESQNGVKSYFTPELDGQGFRQLKTEIYFPFQCLDAMEMGLLGSFLFPSFGFEVSRREPLGLVEKAKDPSLVGLVPVETLFKVRGAERVVSPRSVTMELLEGVHFTSSQLLQALPQEICRELRFLHKLPPDTCMFFYGGETRDHEHLQQMLSPLDRQLTIEVPSYGFLCWKSQFAAESGSPITRSPSAFAGGSEDSTRPDSTAGGLRVIAYVKYGSRRPFRWSHLWNYKRNQIEQVEKMVKEMRNLCRQYVCNTEDTVI